MFTIAIHGGAGLSTPEDLGAEREHQARIDLQQSLQAAHAILSNGGKAIDAVVAAVQVMENSPLFNAGRGAVLASDGGCYMDASIMDGETENAGALSGSSVVQNPIVAAQKVMTETPYVMLVGESLNRFAQSQGLECKDPEWFKTDYRRAQLKEAIRNNTMILDHEKAEAGVKRNDNCKGTVGAVALDLHGNLAAATSTGGLCNKDPGRVGDSALIGAGTYAKNSTCAISATGHGERFIRANVAGRMSAMMEFGGMTLTEASDQLIFEELPNDIGGLISVDRTGKISLPFNTGGMFRGWMTEEGVPHVNVWKNEKQ
jgi:L-asparaginase / beta-aspartyl-peptidase